MRAYQAADDLQDITASAAEAGKPTGQDAELGRPNLGRTLGIEGTRQRLRELIGLAVASIPEGRARPLVRGWVERLSRRLLSIGEVPALNTAWGLSS